ncbi:MAG: alkylphosphonate utilization protein [Thermoleophilaceae bacterium]|nr:alkylphosphonate utilization protein [Thermoleophilaceae bacterium]
MRSRSATARVAIRPPAASIPGCSASSTNFTRVNETPPPCPACASEYTYELNGQQVCSMCAHEWTPGATAAEDAAPVIKDSAGQVLADGDTVVVIKELKVKGASSIKRGTKVRGIRLVDGVGDHDIDCKIDGFGPMQLKSSVVKKA